MPMAGSMMMSIAPHLGSPYMILQMLLSDLGKHCCVAWESLAATVIVIATICWNWSMMCGLHTSPFSDWQNHGLCFVWRDALAY